MAEHEIYPNAPVVLAALEVRHPTAEALTPAQRILLKQRLNSHVPIMRSGNVRLEAVQTAGGPAASLRAEDFPRFFSRDNTTAVSVRAESIVVETTRYSGWERLRALAADVLAVRQEIGGVDGIERAGLRYVNEIRVPDGPAEGWASWVDPALLGPTRLSDELGMAATQWQGVSAFTPGPERSVVLRYGTWDGFAVAPGGDLKRASLTPGPFFLMDIDSFWTPGQDVPAFDVKDLLATLEELHAPVHGIFESLITDRLREEVLRHAH